MRKTWYEVTCFDIEFQQKYTTAISAFSDDKARKLYRQCRLDNPTFHDWRMWRLGKDGKMILIAVNEG